MAKAIPRQAIARGRFVRPDPLPPAERNRILNVAGKGMPPQRVIKSLAAITDPIPLRAAVLRAYVPEAIEDVKLVGRVLRAEGAGPFFRDYPELAGAVLHEIYERANETQLDEEQLVSGTKLVFDEAAELLYEDKVRRVLDAADFQVSMAQLRLIRERMQADGIGFDSGRFERAVFTARSELTVEQKFAKFFDQDPAGQKTVKDELLADLTAQRQRRAVRQLLRLGLDPDNAVDPDWARIALALSQDGAGGRDILALSSFTVGADGLAGDFDLDFPDFETAETVGLIPENIRTCGDLYYIHTFDRLGTFRAVDALAVRFFDTMNLGLGETARKLYVYIKRRNDRIPAEDRGRMTARLFEGGPNGHGTFKLLMGQMVEALIEYNRARNAGELLVGAGDRLPASARRSAVLRSVENLQRYLSRSGGGMGLFLAREAGAQLMDCFEILGSDELRSYFGGEFTEGMFSIIEELVEQADGRPGPPADRMRTLAVHGRKIIRFLADHANHLTTLSDEDLDELSEHVHNWLAAYRRPDIEEPAWLDDDLDREDEDEGPGARAVREALDEADTDEEPDVLAEAP